MAEDPREAARRRIEERKRANADAASRSSVDTAARNAARARIEARRAARPGAEKKDDGPSGFFGHITDAAGDVAHAARSLPAGLVTIAKDVVTEVRNTPDIRTGKPGFGAAPGRKKGETSEEYRRRVRPFTTEAIASAKRTGGRVVDLGASLAPGGQKPSESQYGAAVREGNLVPVLLEDVGNLAIVGGAASKALGAAGTATGAAATRSAAGATTERAAARAATAQRAGRLLDRAAETTHNVARLGERGSGLPARVFTAPAGVVAKAARPVVERALATTPGQRARVFAADAAEKAEVGPVSREFREISSRGRALQGELAGQVVKASETAERLLPNADEQAAMSLVVQGEVGPLRRLAGLDEGQRARVLAETFPAGDVTPAAADIAVRYAEDRLPAEQAQRLTQAIAATREGLRGPRLEREVAGFGRKEPLPAEQLGTAPLQHVPEPFAARLGALDEKRAQTIATQERERAAVIADVERAKRRAAKVEAAQVTETGPRTFGQGRRAGRSGERARAARAAQRDAERRLAALDARHSRQVVRIDKSAAKVRREADESPLSAPARFRPAIIAAQRSRAALRSMADELPEDARGPLLAAAEEMPIMLDALVAAGLDPEHLIGGRAASTRRHVFAATDDEARLPRSRRLASEQLRRSAVTERSVRGQAAREGEQIAAAVGNEVAKEVEARFGVRAGDVGVADVAGAELLAAMSERGLAPWDARRPAGLTGPVGPETVFVPSILLDQYAKTFGAPGFGEQLARTLIDKPTRVWKASVLAFSPRWHIGNAVGNSLMATIGGGLTPVELAQGLAQARRLLREHPEQLPRGLLGRGLFAEEIGYLRGETRPPRGRVRRLAAKSYALNGYVDDLNRTAIYLVKKGDGLSDEAAVKAALRTAGDFQNLTSFERQWVKRLDPFWPWHRHITQLAFRLPIEAPARAAWVLHLADLYAPGDQAGSPLTEGDYPLGDDRYLQLSALNPFGAALTSPVLSPGNAVASLGPVWQLAAAAATGTSLRRGGSPLTRPRGTADRDAFGRDTATPLFRRPAELASVVGRLFPQVRLAQDVTEGPKIRFDTGAPMRVSGEDLPTGSTRASSIFRYFGVPTVETVDEADIAARKRAREQAAARSRRRN